MGPGGLWGLRWVMGGSVGGLGRFLMLWGGGCGVVGVLGMRGESWGGFCGFGVGVLASFRGGSGWAPGVLFLGGGVVGIWG